MRDLIIAGGGPIGLATALHAAAAGLDVEIREPRSAPIDKACGEGLMPGALDHLARLGIDPAGMPFDGIRYLQQGADAVARFRSGPGRGVRRTTLHAALSDAVSRAGIPIEQRAVTRTEQRDSCVLVDGAPARYLIAADGLRSPIRSQLGLDARTARARRFGLRAHLELAPWSRFVEVHWAPGSEAYVTPVAADLVGVALLTERTTGFDALLDEHPQLRARIGAVPRSKVLGAGPLRQRSRRRVAGRVLLVGDASGYVDALTGEGIALGLAHAQAAVAAIRADRPARYERDWWRLTWRHAALTHAVLAASRTPLLRARIVPAARSLPRVFAAAVNQLAS